MKVLFEPCDEPTCELYDLTTDSQVFRKEIHDPADAEERVAPSRRRNPMFLALRSTICNVLGATRFLHDCPEDVTTRVFG